MILSADVQDEFLQRLMGGCRSPLVCLNPSQWALTQHGSPFSFRALRGNPASRRADQLLPTHSSSPLCLAASFGKATQNHILMSFHDRIRCTIKTFPFKRSLIIIMLLGKKAQRGKTNTFFSPFQFRNINPLLIAWGQWC